MDGQSPLPAHLAAWRPRGRHAAAFRIKAAVVLATLATLALLQTARQAGLLPQAPPLASALHVARAAGGGPSPPPPTAAAGVAALARRALHGVDTQLVGNDMATEDDPEQAHGAHGGDGELCGAFINTLPPELRCIHTHCADEAEGVVDWTHFHYCAMAGVESVSVTLLVLAVLAAFFLLGETAEEYFCPVIRRLAADWRLSEATAGVTLLALGNGSPDVFASLAAFVSGSAATGTGMMAAIVSAGGFITAFVVGAVAVAAAPFRVAPATFLRDAVFYLAASLAALRICFVGEVHLWEAALLPLAYGVFVAVVIVSDRLRTAARDAAAVAAAGAAGKPANLAMPPPPPAGAALAAVAGGAAVGSAAPARELAPAGAPPSARLYGAGAPAWRAGAGQGAAAQPGGAATIGGASSAGAGLVGLRLLPANRRERDWGGASSGAAMGGMVGVAASGGGEGAAAGTLDGGAAAGGAAVAEMPGDGSGDGEPDGASAKLAARVGGRRPQLRVLAARQAAAWRAEWAALSATERAVALARLPFDVARRATVPSVDDAQWNLLWALVNPVAAPLFVLYSVRELLPLDYTVLQLGSWVRVPLWALVTAQGLGLSAALYRSVDAAGPPPVWRLMLIVSFITSIVWISTAAAELLGALSTLGTIMGISPSILGITVLAWGNSVGDLVADVVIAHAGQPTMAVAACFSGPLFNMLIGLGLAWTIKCARLYPNALHLHYHPNIPVSFGFLFASVGGSLAAVPLSGFRVTKAWGCCLIALYLTAILTAVAVELGALPLGGSA